MRKLKFILLLFCTPLLLSAQSQAVRLPDFPANRYEGGAEAVYRLMGSSLRYPADARHAGIIGTAILGFSLLPDGQVTNIEMTNPLGKIIDDEVKQVFAKTTDHWLASPDDMPVRMYLPIAFTIDGLPLIRAGMEDDLFIEEIVVKAFGPLRANIRSRERLIESLYKFIEKKKHRRALGFADELVRRDSFNKEWYLVRSSIHKEMGEDDAVCHDLSKIQQLLQYPVSEKLLEQYCR
jgi:TonB family protein